MGRQLPTIAPSKLRAGKPPRTTAISVVVPPMSATMAFCRPLSAHAPSTLAAGPDKTVLTGRCRALATLISEPSPLTIISGASICRWARVRCTESIRVLTCEIMRAFSAAVSARRGAPRLDASSWPQVTGTSHSSCTQARTCISWAGLRTAKVAEIAKAETRLACLAMAARQAASSSAASATPPASWPPGRLSIASIPSRSSSPLVLTWCAS